MRQIRIFRVAWVQNKSAYARFFRENPGIASRPHGEQKAVLDRGGYVGYSGFPDAMRGLGHEAVDVAHDAEVVQKTWAREKGVLYREAHWAADILLAQIADFRPDVVYFQDFFGLPYGLLPEIKARCSSVRVVFMYKGQANDFYRLKGVDVLLTGVPSFIPAFRRAGFKDVRLLYHAFDDRLVRCPCRAASPVHDIVFVGSSGYLYLPLHHVRYWDLVRMMRETPMEAWVLEEERVPFWTRTAKRPLRRLLIDLLSGGNGPLLRGFSGAAGLSRANLLHMVFEALDLRHRRDSGLLAVSGKRVKPPSRPIRELFPERSHPAVFGTELYDVLSRSRVIFNRHVAEIGGSVGNMRMFDSTGLGACLLTDTAVNMPDLFEADTEVVTYGSIAECVEKARYLLDHEEERVRIAAAGLARTRRDHTVENRCRRIDEILQGML